jgi:catechol 2,3-dioxygenase-like lactoylglutathione lyase family enzyme
MSNIRQFDHVGITVADLDSVTAFFADLGLEVEGRTVVWRMAHVRRPEGIVVALTERIG